MNAERKEARARYQGVGIYAGPLIALAPRILASAVQGAQIVLSGLLAEHAD